jgi:hydroxymethylbilane synthase
VRDKSSPFVLGSRGSPLALAQARMVAQALEAAHGWPAGNVAVQVVRTSGDRIQDRPLAEVGGKALWTKELDAALIAGVTHASVHSAKDIESERPQTLLIAACLARADVRDRLIGAGSIDGLSSGARVGTSSPRRTAQLLRLRPDLQVESIRGNVATRLGRVAAGDFDATLLAAAGLDRLGIAHGSAIDVATMLPAPTQGTIAIECRAGDDATRELLAAIDHPATRRALLAERGFTLAVGGSCHSPIAALAIEEGDGSLWLRAELLSSDGSAHVAGEVRFLGDDSGAPELLAAELLARAPAMIRGLFEGPP